MHRSKQKRFLLVLKDYFSKWIEAESFAKVKSENVESFIRKNIICHRGIPYEIHTDNGPHFTSDWFKDFCERMRINLTFSTPYYPQANSQDEAANKKILDVLKKRLDAKKGRWAEELEGVLWSYRTTLRRGTNDLPFALVYGTEGVIPAETEVPSLRRELPPQNTDQNDQMLIGIADTVDERRDQATVRLQNYHNAAARFYNKK